MQAPEGRAFVFSMFWTRSKEKPAHQGEDSLADRVRTLSTRLDDVESDSRKLRSEWLDTLDKLHRQAQRVAKRQERELSRLAGPADAGDGAGAPPDSDPVDRIIRLRRNRGG